MNKVPKEHAFLHQGEDWHWTVYVGVYPDAEKPMAKAKIVAEGFELFDDAVKFAKQKGFGKNRLVVQFLKRG